MPLKHDTTLIRSPLGYYESFVERPKSDYIVRDLPPVTRNNKRSRDLEEGSPPGGPSRKHAWHGRYCGHIIAPYPHFGLDTNYSSDSESTASLRSPKSTVSAPLTLKPPKNFVSTITVNQGAAAMMHSSVTVKSKSPQGPADHPFTNLTLTRPSRSPGQGAVRVVLKEELRRRDGSAYRAPILFGQSDGIDLATNSVVKIFSHSDPALGTQTRDHRGHLQLVLNSDNQAGQEVLIAGAVNNDFAPLNLWKFDNHTLVEYPLAKADLNDVARHLDSAELHHKIKSKSDRLFVRHLVACRAMSDLLPQLARLHESGYSHNNIKLSNIVMNAHGYFHLIGWGCARKSNLPAAHGLWRNKRFESVTGDHSDTRQDDIWALGKVFFQLLLGPKEQASKTKQNKSRPLYNDPFKPNYVYPGPDNAHGWTLSQDLPAIGSNVREAQALLDVWRVAHAHYQAWYQQKRQAMELGTEFNKPLPAVAERYASGPMAQHAHRMQSTFQAVADSDGKSTAFRLCLALFAANNRTAHGAQSIFLEHLRFFKSLDRKLADFTDEEFDALPADTQNRYHKQERLLRAALGDIEGTGMKICTKISDSHRLGPTSPGGRNQAALSQ